MQEGTFLELASRSVPVRKDCNFEERPLLHGGGVGEAIGWGAPFAGGAGAGG